jgi:hypothetical protein
MLRAVGGVAGGMTVVRFGYRANYELKANLYVSPIDRT